MSGQGSGSPLHRLPSVPSELGRRVAEDVYAGWRQAGRLEVAAQVAVEGAAADPPAIFATRRPQGLLRLHGGQFFAEGSQGCLDGLECWLGQFAFPPLAALAPVGVVDSVSLIAEVPCCEIQNLGAPPVDAWVDSQ